MRHAYVAHGLAAVLCFANGTFLRNPMFYPAALLFAIGFVAGLAEHRNAVDEETT